MQERQIWCGSRCGCRVYVSIWCFSSFRKLVSAIAPGGAPKFGVRPDAGAGFVYRFGVLVVFESAFRQ